MTQVKQSPRAYIKYTYRGRVIVTPEGMELEIDQPTSWGVRHILACLNQLWRWESGDLRPGKDKPVSTWGVGG